MRIKIFLIIFAVLILCSCGTQPTQTKAVPDVTGEFKTEILKVGQADAIILTTANHTAIIDCGETDDGDEVVKHLTKNGVQHIDYFFITHFDKDHVGGVPEVLDNFSVGKIITPNYESENEEYKNYLKKVDELKIIPERITENTSYVLDDVLLEIYPPEKAFYESGDNNYSLAIAARHGENSFLFAGDAVSERISEILKQCRGEYIVLKVPHHGKYNKNSKKLIDMANPKYAVITDSDKNQAEDKVVSALNSVSCKAYFTRNGNVSVVSDGKSISISQ